MIYGNLSANIIRVILADNKDQYFGTALSPEKVNIVIEIIATLGGLVTVAIIQIVNN